MDLAITVQAEAAANKLGRFGTRSTQAALGLSDSPSHRALQETSEDSSPNTLGVLRDQTSTRRR